jgi:hypothetical protein
MCRASGLPGLRRGFCQPAYTGSVSERSHRRNAKAVVKGWSESVSPLAGWG